MIFSVERVSPAPKNLHETGMIDTIKENYLISNLGVMAGRKQKPFI